MDSRALCSQDDYRQIIDVRHERGWLWGWGYSYVLTVVYQQWMKNVKIAFKKVGAVNSSPYFIFY